MDSKKNECLVCWFRWACNRHHPVRVQNDRVLAEEMKRWGKISKTAMICAGVKSGLYRTYEDVLADDKVASAGRACGRKNIELGIRLEAEIKADASRLNGPTYLS